jgi:hypothetical protein
VAARRAGRAGRPSPVRRMGGRAQPPSPPISAAPRRSSMPSRVSVEEFTGELPAASPTQEKPSGSVSPRCCLHGPVRATISEPPWVCEQPGGGLRSLPHTAATSLFRAAQASSQMDASE